MLALLSVRITDQPQRWAAAPALFMGLGGLLLLGFGSSVHGVLDWLAARLAGVGDLDVRPRPSAASEPCRTLAALPGDRVVGACRDRRRLGDPGCGGGRQG